MLTDQQIEEIARRESVATAGPWENKVVCVAAEVNNGHLSEKMVPLGTCALCGDTSEIIRKYTRTNGIEMHIHKVSSEDDNWWRHIYASDGTKIVGNYEEESGGVASTKDDSDFIAHAREDIKELLSDRNILVAVIDELEKRLAQIRSGDFLGID